MASPCCLQAQHCSLCETESKSGYDLSQPIVQSEERGRDGPDIKGQDMSLWEQDGRVATVFWEGTLVSTLEPHLGPPQLTVGNLMVVGSPLRDVWGWSQRNAVCYWYWVEGKTVAK